MVCPVLVVIISSQSIPALAVGVFLLCLALTRLTRTWQCFGLVCCGSIASGPAQLLQQSCMRFSLGSPRGFLCTCRMFGWLCPPVLLWYARRCGTWWPCVRLRPCGGGAGSSGSGICSCTRVGLLMLLHQCRPLHAALQRACFGPSCKILQPCTPITVGLGLRMHPCLLTTRTCAWWMAAGALACACPSLGWYVHCLGLDAVLDVSGVW